MFWRIHHKVLGGEGDNMAVDVNQMNSLTLAYIGDAVYELHIRHFLVESGGVKPHQLHERAIKFVAATAQASIIKYLIDTKTLTKEEQDIMRRGRNAKSTSIPKNVSVQKYRYSTGFEALIGYLYLKGKSSRLKEVINKSIQFINN